MTATPEPAAPAGRPVALLITGVLVALMVVFVAVYPDDGTGNGTPRSGPPRAAHHRAARGGPGARASAAIRVAGSSSRCSA